jgi:hypothetical protein
MMDTERRLKSLNADALALEDHLQNGAGDEDQDREPKDKLQQQEPADAFENGVSSSAKVSFAWRRPRA